MAAPAVGLVAPTPLFPPVLPAGRRPPLVAGALAAATLLLLLAIQGSGPQFVGRPASPASSPAAPVHTPKVDAATAAEVALHAPVAVPGRPGTLRVQAPDYAAGFDPVGLSFAPTGVSDQVHAVVPVAAAHERQSVASGVEGTRDSASAVIVE